MKHVDTSRYSLRDLLLIVVVAAAFYTVPVSINSVDQCTMAVVRYIGAYFVALLFVVFRYPEVRHAPVVGAWPLIVYMLAEWLFDFGGQSMRLAFVAVGHPYGSSDMGEYAFRLHGRIWICALLAVASALAITVLLSLWKMPANILAWVVAGMFLYSIWAWIQLVSYL